MHVLAIIPARGGSKRLPRKNVRPFLGKPLIAWSIEHAKASSSVTRTIVTTDDPEIADVARAHGAEVPFMRPAELAEDGTRDLPVFQHALRWLEEHEQYRPDVVVHLRPTSPTRTPQMIDDAVRLLVENPEADSVRGIIHPHEPPHKMWTRDAPGFLKPLLDVPGVAEPYNAPDQALPEVWYQIGYIDAIRPEVILQKNSMTGSRILGLPLGIDHYTNIDTEFDWRMSEEYFRKK